MATTFEYSKTLAMEGSILLLLSVVPYVGWVLGIIGVILLLRGMKEFANYYQDNQIYENALTGVKYYIVAIVALAIAGAGFIVGLVVNNFASLGTTAAFGVGNAVGLAVGAAFLVVAFVFYVLAAMHLKRTFSTLAQKTGEHSFETASTLLWIGAILTIIGVGVLLIFVAWIFAVVGFSTVRNPQMQQQYASQQYGYNQPNTQAPTGTAQTANYCSTCGKSVKPQGT